MKLNEDTTNTTITDDSQLVVEPSYLDYLRRHNYSVDGVEDVRIVPSSSRDIGHVVARVYVYELPDDHEDLDLVKHRREACVCSCEDYTYTQSVDVSETTLRDGNLGECRHCREAFREERARADDSQQSLGDSE